MSDEKKTQDTAQKDAAPKTAEANSRERAEAAKAQAQAQEQAKAEAKAKEAEANEAAEPAPETEVEAAPKAAPALQLTEPPKGNIVATAWLVLILAMAFGSGLAGIETWLSPIIEQNKLNEALSQIPNLVPGAQKGAKDEQTIPGRRIFRALDGSGNLVGWVVPGKGQGFADKIEVLIGLAPEAKKLTGIFVLDQKETPGLGNYIVDEPFTKQFRGLAVGGSHKLLASQAPPKLNLGQIKAVTGATISSQTVCDIVNKTVGELQSKLAAARSTKLPAPAATKKGG